MRLRRILAFGLILTTPASSRPPCRPLNRCRRSMRRRWPRRVAQGHRLHRRRRRAGGWLHGPVHLARAAGTFSADGAEMLAIRVGELAAIAQLGQLSQTGVFADALAASAMKTGAAIEQAVTNPVETIAGIPGGVGRFFQSAATTISRATESAGMRTQRAPATPRWVPRDKHGKAADRQTGRRRSLYDQSGARKAAR